MARKQWNEFPYSDPAFDYSGAGLKKAWSRLHLGDQEPFPDVTRVKALLKAAPAVEKELNAEPKAIAEQVQQAWRLYHAGDFQAACELGTKLGPIGAVVASKAQGIYANYLEDDEQLALDMHMQAAKRVEHAAAIWPDCVNAHYQRAYNLGRYSQGISVAAALAQGMGGKVKDSLERTLKLAPDHAEACSALGMFHAEIIASVGAVVGGLTYGAKKDAALKLFDRALELHPESAVAHMEYANGLLALFGDKRHEQAVELYEQAAACEPVDAMEALDVEQARAELE